MQDLNNAYYVFENDLMTIAIITDGDFISVTEFSKLLNTILGIHSLAAKFINQELLNHNIISKTDKKIIKRNKKLGIKSNKFIAHKSVEQYCKEINYTTGKYYIWNARLLFLLFGIDFDKKITQKVVNNFCCIINKYVRDLLDHKIVQQNLIYLQLIFLQYYYND